MTADTTGDIELWRKRLLFRARRRGFREADLLMGGFADEALATMTPSDLEEFERLLAAPDWEVYAWAVGQSPEPPNYSSDVLERLKAFATGPLAEGLQNR